MESPSQSYGASSAVWDHTVLPATRRRWTRPALTPARYRAGGRAPVLSGRLGPHVCSGASC